MTRAKKSSKHISCRTKVVAIAFTKKHELLGIGTNKIRLHKKGGGIHAESGLIERYGKKIKYIYIFRFNKSGLKLPIHPCPNCQKLADKYNIKIIPYEKAE
jgi:hypothetical protein